MDQIKFKSGEFLPFTTTRGFALGALNVTVSAGADLEFDGSTVRYAGQSYTFPQMRGAYTAGWIVLSSDYEEGNPEYNRPVSANIKMRPPTDDKGTAKTASTTVEADEHIVMSSADHAANTRQQNKAAKVGGSTVAEDQDGVPVRRGFKTSTKNKTDLTSAGEAIRAAENVQIQAGKGVTEAEMLSRMSEEDRATYLESKASHKARYTDVEAPQSVGKVKTASTKEAEGMKLTQKVGGGVEIADAGGTGGQAKASMVTEDGITFKNTNGPEQHTAKPHPRSAEAKKPVMLKDGTADVRLRIAKSLCSEFPASYDFAASDKKKLARLQADFEDRPDVLRAVFAAESDDFKAKLIEEFPQAFQG